VSSFKGNVAKSSSNVLYKGAKVVRAVKLLQQHINIRHSWRTFGDCRGDTVSANANRTTLKLTLVHILFVDEYTERERSLVLARIDVGEYESQSILCSQVEMHASSKAACHYSPCTR
jgi:hypothetical protein